MKTPHIIHNEKNTPRHLSILEQLSINSITDYTFEPAVFMSDTTHAVATAHKNVVLKYSDQKQITIFEDDIIFTKTDSWEKYWEWYEELPDNWDVYLGGIYGWKVKESVTENLEKVRRPFAGIHWYTIRDTFYERFLNCPKEKHIDKWIGHTGCYVYVPKLLPSRQADTEFEPWASSERITNQRAAKKGITTPVPANYKSLRMRNKYY